MTSTEISAVAKILLNGQCVVSDGRVQSSKRDAVTRRLRAAVPSMDVREALDLAGSVVRLVRKTRRA